MNGYIIGLIAILSFTLLVGVGALIFTSFDSHTPTTARRRSPATMKLADSVRRINTDTIETVDPSGNIEQWARVAKPDSSLAG